jgi:hypothetical protein
VGQPDIADLDRFMWETDSRFDRRPTADGGVEILAKGPSAVTLVTWIQEAGSTRQAPFGGAVNQRGEASGGDLRAQAFEHPEWLQARHSPSPG